MCLAKHLAIRSIRCTAFTPCRYMICIHLILLIFTLRIVIVTDSTERTVGNAFFFSLFCLFIINRFLCLFIKHANIQKRSILFATKDVFKDTFIICDLRIIKQLVYTFSHFIF